MKSLLSNFPLLVPCLVCKEHLFNFISSSDLNKATDSRESLFKFIVDLHNYVNLRLGKPQMTLDDAKNLYGYDKSGIGKTIKISYS